MVTVSVPFDTDGGAPGAMNISTVASQVPTSFLSIACSGPGVGMGGIWARAGTSEGDEDTDTTTARTFFMALPPGLSRESSTGTETADPSAPDATRALGCGRPPANPRGSGC